jgi:hypothetical protein
MSKKSKAELPPASDLPRFRPGQPVIYAERSGKPALVTVERRYERGVGAMGRASFWGLPAFEGQSIAWGVSYGQPFRNGRPAIGALVTVPDSRLGAR